MVEEIQITDLKKRRIVMGLKIILMSPKERKHTLFLERLVPSYCSSLLCAEKLK
jgi:hypothetical protein